MTRQTFENRIIFIIEQNINNPQLNGAFIAEAMNTNRMNIHRRLKLYFNQNASEFILEQRLNKAKNMLKNSNLKITEIALEVGFKDIAYFSKVFKNQTSLSPSEFRKQHS